MNKKELPLEEEKKERSSQELIEDIRGAILMSAGSNTLELNKALGTNKLYAAEFFSILEKMLSEKPLDDKTRKEIAENALTATEMLLNNSLEKAKELAFKGGDYYVEPLSKTVEDIEELRKKESLKMGMGI